MAICPVCGSKDSEAQYRDQGGGFGKVLDPRRQKCKACGKLFWI